MSAQDDPHDLLRFVAAQDAAGAYEQALAQLRRGRKTGHWMWFVFPQLEGLGRSEMARRYAISGLDEARAYLRHPILGPRLRACARALVELDGERAAEEVLGSVDALKLRSCMTLFSRADPDEPLFRAVLERYFGARGDPLTEARL
ncbi:MAG TPA: DUF1810 domain-containing protein [Solirubrobacteraceae bacterium]|nr:DUF1810 domain-containing protein [Solirubrobacteraceae bacterium]